MHLNGDADENIVNFATKYDLMLDTHEYIHKQSANASIIDP